MDKEKWLLKVESKLKDQKFNDWINYQDKSSLKIPRFSLEKVSGSKSNFIFGQNYFCSGKDTNFTQEEKEILKKYQINNIFSFQNFQSKQSINLCQANLSSLSSVEQLGYISQKLIQIFDQSLVNNNWPDKIDCLFETNSQFFEMMSFISSIRILFDEISASYDEKVELVLWSLPSSTMQNETFTEGNYLKNLYSALAAKFSGVNNIVARTIHYTNEEEVFTTDLQAYLNLCLLDEEGGLNQLETLPIDGATLIDQYQQQICDQVWDQYIIKGRDKFLTDDEWEKLAKDRFDSLALAEDTIVGVTAFQSDLFQQAKFSNAQGQESHHE